MQKSEAKLKKLAKTDITAGNLQDDVIGPIIIKEYRKQVTKKTNYGNYRDILGFYIHSTFQDFENHLRTERFG